MKRSNFKTKLAVVTLAFTLSTTQASAFADNDKPIQFNQLPVAAQNMVKKHFNNAEIALITMDKEVFKTDYEVIFNNGAKLKFNKNGQWKSIDTNRKAVPSNLVPKQIKNYVKKNYNNAKIVEIERDKKGYNIELNNGVELDFNTRFEIIEIDY